MKMLAKLLGKSEAVKVKYTTRSLEPVRSDGSWTAELSKDGVPYGQINVGSISALITASK